MTFSSSIGERNCKCVVTLGAKMAITSNMHCILQICKCVVTLGAKMTFPSNIGERAKLQICSNIGSENGNYK